MSPLSGIFLDYCDSYYKDEFASQAQHKNKLSGFEMSLTMYSIMNVNLMNKITMLHLRVPAKNISPIAFQGLKNMFALNHLSI